MTILGPTPDLSQGPLDMSRPAWYADAACRGEPTAMFFPDRDHPPKSVEAERIAELCGSCPVRDDCEAAGWREPDGYWGGRSRKARQAMQRATRARNRGGWARLRDVVPAQTGP